jgi:hypothetical protein
MGCGFCQTIRNILVAAGKRKLTYFLKPSELLELRKIDTQAVLFGRRFSRYCFKKSEGIRAQRNWDMLLQESVQVVPKRKCLVKSVGQGNGFTRKTTSHDARGLARAERQYVTNRSFVLQCNDVTEL